MINCEPAVKFILDNIFSFEVSRLNDDLTKLIEENNALRGDWNAGVMYMGHWYHYPSATKPDRFKPPMDVVVHPTLFERFRTFANDNGLVRRDREKFEQGFHRLFKQCANEADFLDAIPAFCLAYFDLTATGHTRQKPEGHPLMDDLSALARWNKLVDRMIYYNTLRMMY